MAEIIAEEKAAKAAAEAELKAEAEARAAEKKAAADAEAAEVGWSQCNHSMGASLRPTSSPRRRSGSSRGRRAAKRPLRAASAWTRCSRRESV